jgi:DNA modification methylase
LFKKGSTTKARNLAKEWITNKLHLLNGYVSLGLPEYDDRLDRWRIAIKLKNGNHTLLGEVCTDRHITEIVDSTNIQLLRERVNKYKHEKAQKSVKGKKSFTPSAVPNKVILGNCIDVLEEYPPDTAQLVFTSPPYYNAKPEYSEFVDYQEYLDFMRKVIIRIHPILSEGRFFVVNVSPVLIRRVGRNSSSKRIPIPFDLHRIFETAGYDFIDDIIWVKPEGAGWNLGRGRRFRADRQPLQYKPVPITEYILVYRKRTDKLIDWNLRKHHDRKLVEESKVNGDYDVTNLWRIHPAHSKVHPAVFPIELAKKVITYYSFKGDMVVDPFAGIGTVGEAAYQLERRFLLIDNEPKYYKYMRAHFESFLPHTARVDFDVHEKFRKEHDEYRL